MSTQDSAAAAIELLPTNLLDATRELAANEALRAGFGKTRTGDYIDYFIQCKQREVTAAHEQITDWELKRYLQLF
jgi:glutamine synthetase